MEQPEGPRHPCPQCGAHRGPDHTPTCACGRRAADALQRSRTAQAAAAEDFDPLRIRPYVELETDEGTDRHTAADAPGGTADAADAPGGTADAAGAPGGPADVADATGADADATMALRPGGPGGPADATGAPGGPGGPGGPASVAGARGGSADTTGAPGADPNVTMTLPPGGPGGPADATGTPGAPGGPADAPGAPGGPADAPGARGVDPDATMTLRPVQAAPAAVDATAVLPTPLAPSASAPSDTDLRMFETAGARRPPGPDDLPDTAEEHPRRRGRGVLAGAVAAVVVVLGAAGYASGLFSYEGPSRDGAQPAEVRAGIPDPSTGAPSVTAPASASAAPSASASPSPSASASESASPSSSPSASASSASPSPSRSAEPSPTVTPSASGAPPTANEDGGDDGDGGGAVLRRGDRGPEVTELQQRLRQINLYRDDIDGVFDREVEDALRTFQWWRGIQSEELGTYGARTREQLERETQEP